MHILFSSINNLTHTTMKFEMKNMAAFVAATLWTDGVYDTEEKAAVAEIAKRYEFEEQAFIACVQNTFDEMNNIDASDMDDYLDKMAEGISGEQEAYAIYDAILQTMLIDKVFSVDEYGNLLAFAQILDLDLAKAMLIVTDLVQKNNVELKL